jgi:hypothetical protein
LGEHGAFTGGAYAPRGCNSSRKACKHLRRRRKIKALAYGGVIETVQSFDVGKTGFRVPTTDWIKD